MLAPPPDPPEVAAAYAKLFQQTAVGATKANLDIRVYAEGENAVRCVFKGVDGNAVAVTQTLYGKVQATTIKEKILQDLRDLSLPSSTRDLDCLRRSIRGRVLACCAREDAMCATMKAAASLKGRAKSGWFYSGAGTLKHRFYTLAEEASKGGGDGLGSAGVGSPPIEGPHLGPFVSSKLKREHTQEEKVHQQSGLQSEGHVVLRGVLDSELADRMFDAHCKSLKTPSCIAEKYGGFFVDKYPSTQGFQRNGGTACKEIQLSTTTKSGEGIKETSWVDAKGVNGPHKPRSKHFNSVVDVAKLDDGTLLTDIHQWIETNLGICEVPCEYSCQVRSCHPKSVKAPMLHCDSVSAGVVVAFPLTKCMVSGWHTCFMIQSSHTSLPL